MHQPFQTTQNLLTWSELGSAPSLPGLYAWYLRPRLHRFCLESPSDTQKFLSRLAANLRFPDSELSMRGPLSLKLQGRLYHDHLGNRVDNKPQSLHNLIENRAGRQLLATIFDQMVPALSSPLYIGISSDVQQRLSQHKSLILKYQDDQNNTPIDGTASLARDQSFASEITKREIDPNHLCVIVTAIHGPSNLSGHELRSFIEGAETLLNRVYYPILGRR